MMAENCQSPANVKHDQLITNNVSLLSKLQTHNKHICTISGHCEMWHFGRCHDFGPCHAWHSLLARF